MATDLVERTIKGQAELTLAESLSVLLLTWNNAYYRFRGFDEDHLVEIERLVDENLSAILGYRAREITALKEWEGPQIKKLFGDFEKELGPVGAAKALHMLAPLFFPLWDRGIAKAYGLELGKTGTNSRKYLAFMRVLKEMYSKLKGKILDGSNILKLIDEYNYCRYTKGWL